MQLILSDGTPLQLVTTYYSSPADTMMAF